LGVCFWLEEKNFHFFYVTILFFKNNALSLQRIEE